MRTETDTLTAQVGSLAERGSQAWMGLSLDTLVTMQRKTHK
jgi:hypothetical protein